MVIVITLFLMLQKEMHHAFLLVLCFECTLNSFCFSTFFYQEVDITYIIKKFNANLWLAPKIWVTLGLELVCSFAE